MWKKNQQKNNQPQKLLKNNMPYTTLSTLKKHLNITDTMHDDILKAMIATLSAMMDFELGDSLEKRVVRKRIDGSGTNCLIMENPFFTIQKIVNIHSKKEYPVDFVDGYLVYTTDTIPRGRKNIDITYECGFDEVPKDFEAYFLEFCKGHFLLNDNIFSENIESKKIADISITYLSGDKLAQIYTDLKNTNLQKILAKYKNFSIVC